MQVSDVLSVPTVRLEQRGMQQHDTAENAPDQGYGNVIVLLLDVFFPRTRATCTRGYPIA